jgi:ATP-dependent DNA ligase
MTALLPELDNLPAGLSLDAELAACKRSRLAAVVPTGASPRWAVPIQLVIFDLLALDDKCLLARPLEERRSQLEALRLHGPTWMAPNTLDEEPRSRPPSATAA